jgi:hypothetical protein
MARKKKTEGEAPETQEGFTRMDAPEDATSFSVNGEEFEVGEDGTVEVPDHVAVELVAHGFTKAK